VACEAAYRNATPAYHSLEEKAYARPAFLFATSLSVGKHGSNNMPIRLTS